MPELIYVKNMNFKTQMTHENILTTPTQKTALIAASTAFPPSFKTATPMSEHRLFSEATAPCSASMR
jgi:hypothetical protein